MITVEKVGGSDGKSSAIFNMSKTSDVVNLPTKDMPNCSKAINWSNGDLYYFDGDDQTWHKQM